MDLTREKDIGVKAVLEASRFCAKIQHTMGSHTSIMKEDKTPVTIADFGSQAIVCRILNESFPGAKIVAEEHSFDLFKDKNSKIPGFLKSAINKYFDSKADISDISWWVDMGDTQSSNMQWILDPLDGTRGFLRGHLYAVALAFMINGKIELGFLGCPNLSYDKNKKGCLFVAQRGRGSEQIWLKNISVNRAIQVSSEREGRLLKFVESVEVNHMNHDFSKELHDRLKVKRAPIRLDSQAKYGMVARGEASAYIRLHASKYPNYRQKIWDHAAGSIIVEEAKGNVTDLNGKPLDFTCGKTLEKNIGIVATNGICHQLIIENIRTLE